MLQITNEVGMVIDGTYINVACVHQKALDIPNFIGANGMYWDCIQAIYDMEIPDHVNIPIVGITLYEGVGYTCLSYVKSRQKRIRIWLGFLSDYLFGKHPRLRTLDWQTRDEGRIKQTIAQALNMLGGMSVYLFDANPTASFHRLGINLYDKNGKLLFDSNYNPMKIGTKGNINNGKHLIYPQTFALAKWFENNLIYWREALEVHLSAALLFVYDKQSNKAKEMYEVVRKEMPSRYDELWFSQISTLKWYRQNVQPTLIGYR